MIMWYESINILTHSLSTEDEGVKKISLSWECSVDTETCSSGEFSRLAAVPQMECTKGD